MTDENTVQKEQKPLEENKDIASSGKKGEYVAVVRVRGVTGVKKPIKDTLNMLCLYKHNFCTVRKKTPAVMGMIKRAKDYVTYGEIDSETLSSLKSRMKPHDDKTKIMARLNTPKGGYGRKGIKKSFSLGGALGYRGEKINDLLKRMMY